MKYITNTQYLKVGMMTTAGTVKSIQDNAWFTTTDGFSHNVNDQDISIPEIIAKVVVKKDGSQFTHPDNIVWEYEADPDYLTTVEL